MGATVLDVILKLFHDAIIAPNYMSIDRFILDVLILFVTYMLVSALILVILAHTKFLKKQMGISEDERIKICWAFSILISLVVFTFNITYMRAKNLYHSPTDLLAHWAVFVLLLIVFYFVYRSVRHLLSLHRRAVAKG